MNSNNEKICYFCWYRTKDLYSVFKYCPSIYTFNDFWYGRKPKPTIDELFECKVEIWGSWNNWTLPLIAKEYQSTTYYTKNGEKIIRDRRFLASIKLGKGIYEYKWKFIHKNFTYWIIDPKKKIIKNDNWNENNLYIYK